MLNRPLLSDTRLTVVMPLLNEANILPRLLAELRIQLNEIGCPWSIVLVNDGSTDGSVELLDAMAFGERRLKVVHLSRNFGHQAAVEAGLRHATGDVVVVMDSDGQDDPKAIPAMLERWLDGDEVVYAIRVARKEGIAKRFLFSLFHKLLARVANIKIPRDAGNFSLLDRRVVDELLRCGDKDRYLPGLRSWVGFRQSGVAVERFARHDRHARVTFWGLIRLAKTAFIGFSNAPIALLYLIAAMSIATSLTCSTLAFALPQSAASSAPFSWGVCAVVAFFASLNSLGIAILGEYIARIHDQIRNRPTYVVDKTINMEYSNASPSFAGRSLEDDAWDMVQLDVARLQQELSAIVPLGSRPSQECNVP